MNLDDSLLDLEPSLLRARLSGRQRVLLFGPPGSGKSTLAAKLAALFGHHGEVCACVSGDPGSPAFGVPGAICMGRWTDNGWRCTDVEPLCSLDAGRFRLPLIQALGRLIKRAPRQLILLDGPGVVRGAAGAELLAGIAESVEVDAILALQCRAEASPLEQELRALGLPVLRVRAAAEARRPSKSVRDRRRTALWDKHLEQAVEYRIDLDRVALIGTPPPLDAPWAWNGRQVAFINGERCTAFGEALQLDRSKLRAKLCGDPQSARTLLIRDAARHANGLLSTVEPFRVSVSVSPPPDISRSVYAHTPSEPRPVARIGAATAMLVNGVFGDPLLHIRLQHQRRSLLFDLGEPTRLPARIAHQVTDVFISHCHIDHIGGFVWLLRSRIGKLPACRIYGPPGLADNVMGFISGVHWDRVGERAPRFEVSEVHEHAKRKRDSAQPEVAERKRDSAQPEVAERKRDSAQPEVAERKRDSAQPEVKIQRYRIEAGESKPEILGEECAPEGILLHDAAFKVRATTLDHRTPVLAFALEMKFDLNVRKDRLASLGLAPGTWLSLLKECIASGKRDTEIELSNGATQTAGQIADEVLILRPGPKLAYATDLADTPQNRMRLQTLADGAHTFFCEAPFCEVNAEQSARTGHLTTRACGEIATAAHVERLIPFHFSRRYQSEAERIYAEVSAACSRTIVPRQMHSAKRKRDSAQP
jgi:ribonuclease BN (tRNA processing enzyme)